MQCPACTRRRVAKADTVCRTCRRFITDFIDTGQIRRQPVPMVADVYVTMNRLGVDQDRAVRLLGGQP